MTDISPEVAATVSLGWLNEHPLRGCKVEPLIEMVLDALAAGEFNKARVLAAAPVAGLAAELEVEAEAGDDDQLRMFDRDPVTGEWVHFPDDAETPA